MKRGGVDRWLRMDKCKRKQEKERKILSGWWSVLGAVLPKTHCWRKKKIWLEKKWIGTINTPLYIVFKGPVPWLVTHCRKKVRLSPLLLLFLFCGGRDFLEFRPVRPGTITCVLAVDAVLSAAAGVAVVGFTPPSAAESFNHTEKRRWWRWTYVLQVILVHVPVSFFACTIILLMRFQTQLAISKSMNLKLSFLFKVMNENILLELTILFFLPEFLLLAGTIQQQKRM